MAFQKVIAASTARAIETGCLLYTGGTQTVKNCLYTFVAAWSPERQGWIATGFQQPSLSCALGGLS
jgi:hypothetical protein